MPTYTYETVPPFPGMPTRRFELRQPMSEAPLARDPDTGHPVRRVISGGLATVTRHGESADDGPACGPENCGCERFG